MTRGKITLTTGQSATIAGIRFSIVAPPRNYSRCAACLNQWDDCPAQFHFSNFTEEEKRAEIDTILDALEHSRKG